jgi:uncharacterized protein YecA (UPF0149 family)
VAENIGQQPVGESAQEEQGKSSQMEFKHKENRGLSYSSSDTPKKPATVKRETPKVGRNEDCPCGSGKKYKKCCGV